MKEIVWVHGFPVQFPHCPSFFPTGIPPGWYPRTAITGVGANALRNTLIRKSIWKIPRRPSWTSRKPDSVKSSQQIIERPEAMTRTWRDNVYSAETHHLERTDQEDQCHWPWDQLLETPPWEPGLNRLTWEQSGDSRWRCLPTCISGSWGYSVWKRRRTHSLHGKCILKSRVEEDVELRWTFGAHWVSMTDRITLWKYTKYKVEYVGIPYGRVPSELYISIFHPFFLWKWSYTLFGIRCTAHQFYRMELYSFLGATLFQGTWWDHFGSALWETMCCSCVLRWFFFSSVFSCQFVNMEKKNSKFI